MPAFTKNDIRPTISGKLSASFFAGEVPQFQVIIPDFGIVQGPFQITAIEYGGNYNGEATYEISLASAGVLNFRAI